MYCCLLLSCMDDEDRDQFGFTFRVLNKSGVEHENVKITIGGMENGEFIGTSSYSFPKILVLLNDSDIPGNKYKPQTFAFYEDRWNPNLAEVKAISDKAYFTIQLDRENPFLLYDTGNESELLSFMIPNDNIVVNDYGKFYLSIKTGNSIFGEFPIFN